MMAREVGQRPGIDFPMDVDARMPMAEGLRGHRTSMLEDFERGSPLEIDALLSAVIEMERPVAGEIIFNLVRQRARIAGRGPAAAASLVPRFVR
jgi:2-dehydropantoate 2-reductase